MSDNTKILLPTVLLNLNSTANDTTFDLPQILLHHNCWKCAHILHDYYKKINYSIYYFIPIPMNSIFHVH